MACMSTFEEERNLLSFVSEPTSPKPSTGQLCPSIHLGLDILEFLHHTLQKKDVAASIK